MRRLSSDKPSMRVVRMFCRGVLSLSLLFAGDAMAARGRMPLECFERDALRYVDFRWRHAIVLAPDGRRHVVEPGVYLGQEDGRVVRVTREAIELVELVFDGEGGWLERPETIPRETSPIPRPVPEAIAKSDCVLPPPAGAL